MKKFLINFIVFCFPIILFGAILEVFLSYIPNTYRWKKEILSKNLNDVEILILGSSHALGGLNPDFFHLPAINMANNSQSLFYDINLIYYYRSDLKKLKVVIFEMSFYNLFYTMDEGYEPWRSKFYYKYWNFQPQITKRFLFYDKLYINLYPLNKIFLLNARAKSLDLDATSNGYLKDYSVLSGNKMENSKKRYLSLKNTFYDSQSIKQNIEILNNIIIKLQEDSIKVIFLQYPYWYGFSNMIELKWIRMNDSIYKNWIDKYDVKYFDFSKSKLFRDNFFADVDHVNYIGAELLSKKIDSIIVMDTK